MRKLLFPWLIVNKEGIEELYNGEVINGYDFEVKEGERLGLLIGYKIQTRTYSSSAFVCDDIADLKEVVDREEAKGMELEFRVYKVSKEGAKGLCYSVASESL